MKNNLRFLVILLSGAVLGSVLNDLLARANAPLWLTETLPLGIDPPFTVDLIFLKLSLGLALKMSLMSVVGMLLAVLAFRKTL
ncbi:MAG: DUF4321 domain-containing protein [Fimbriimonadaceae bacterium]|nr:DUF4321 domain-containing protein [Fimbriimonadaceae bacterium]